MKTMKDFAAQQLTKKADEFGAGRPIVWTLPV